MDSQCMGVIENKDGGIQRYELVLNTMKAEGECIVGNERSDEKSVWSECSDHILESLFSTLSVEFSARFRIVCKEWNTLLSSNRFLSLIPERDPWILLCSETHAMAYCFLTQSWKTISLSFLPGPATGDYSEIRSKSGAGLLLIKIIKPQKMYVICNPLTRMYREIPAIIAENSSAVGIMDNGGSYKIVGLSKDENPMCIRIYHCFEMSWQIEDEFSLPAGDFKISKVYCANGLVVCVSQDLKVVIYNTEAKRAHIVSFPETNLSIMGDLEKAWVDGVILCGSSILLVVIYLRYKRGWWKCHVIVWELFEDEGGSVHWKEITRMPAGMCRKFIQARNFIGVGNFLCFTGGHSNNKLFVYSLRDRCWSRIKLPQSVRFNRYNTIFNFQPKPGMKV